MLVQQLATQNVSNALQYVDLASPTKHFPTAHRIA
jgi:hypothetical protein